MRAARRVKSQKKDTALPGRRLYRRFLLVSALATVVIVAASSLGIWFVLRMYVLRDAEEDAVSISTIVRRLEMHHYYVQLAKEGGMLRAVPQEKLSEIDEELTDILEPFDVLDLKVFDAEGRVVYGTDHAQIGSVMTRDEKLAQALSGEPASTYRTRHRARDIAGIERYEVSTVETYIPVRDRQGKVIGGLEIEEDVTHELDNANRATLHEALTLLAIGVLVFATLSFLMYRATRAVDASEAVRRESEDKYMRLFSASSDAIVIFEAQTRRIANVNDAALKLYGYTRDEFLQLKAEDIFAEPQEAFDTFGGIDSGPLRGLSVCHKKKDGAVLPVEASVGSFTTRKGGSFFAVVTDITERRRWEEALQYRSRLEHLIATISNRFINIAVDEIDEEINRALGMIGQFAGVDRSYVLRFSKDLSKAWCTHEWCAKGIEPVGARIQDLSVAAMTWLMERRGSGEPLEVPDLSKLPAELEVERRFLEDMGVKSLLCAPMLWSEKSPGAIGFDLVKSVQSWPEEFVILLGLVGEIFANALERKRAVEAIESLAKFPDENPNPVLRFSSTGAVIYKNKAAAPFLRAWQCDQGALMSDWWHGLVKDAIDSGRALQTERECCGRVYALTFAPFKNAGYVNVYALDVTDRKRAEEEVRQEKERAQGYLDVAGVMLVALNEKGEVTLINKKGCEVLGFPEHEVLGSWYDRFVPVREKEKVKSVFAGLMAGGAELVEYFESLLVTAGGEERLIAWHNVLLKDKDGRTTGTLSSGEDITDRKRAEEALRLRDRAIFEATNGVLITEHRDAFDNPIVYVNPAFQRITGYSLDEIGGKDCRFLQRDDRDQPGLEEIRTALSEGRDCRVTLRNYRKDGSLFWNDLSISPVGGEHGKPTHHVGIINDITDRRLAEESLRKSEERYRGLVEMMNEGLGMADADYVFNYVNDTFCEMLGYSREEMLGHHLLEFVHEDDREMMRDQIAKRRSGASDRFELAWRAKDGRTVYTIASPKALFDAEGRFIGSYGVLTDISDRKRAEESLAQRAADLSALNKELESFAYSVSHDLRAPLRSIDGFSHLLAEDYGDRLDDRAAEHLGRIRGASQRMGQLLDDLLKLARVTRLEMKREAVDISEIARAVIQDLRNAEPERRVDFVIHDGLTARVDKNLLAIALRHLLENAWKFTSRQPSATIECGAKEVEGRKAYFVRDDGAGFDPAYSGRLFGPFQRLHKDSDFPGTGIGLATVRRIIQRHGGRVWAEGTPNKGATFFFTLE